ncbi:cytoskeleton protein RodZ [Vibrio natriegens]|jgi:cytoskeleton protein RodZ|uniref:Transcriptional regulator n=1 Tax=Vibrio natriegens NBRC 15636 = ATCC 14048 = DSM 759 TaxID=1219067 RepID=A0AAN1CUS5_VIBNA|nr:cytoskeleton protein RodZ [Vibrio natriegens]ALR16369.1 transcriptional regulator [Vibrio natriegens NBRC 15636 = ATCC 14048 = DSM 759]ANQ11767.1 transcriptional regulator [Vibrio natriegens NBRC 15636 = ATCC 14048 = DSM 759]ANQ25549.1 transcriptional regulator [Vibrio natriegens]EPM41679.1 transcriptional regulator [Vibrio natriegens NBRC 15636 = ATCC 14048 = DSM 759]MCG9701521.1 cytoskeleton protein RodZ [Vibrio natriegens]
MTEHENTNEVPLSIEAGTLLKNKRESLGMTQKQVADRLRLRVSVIEDIENNRFESQQVATFTRGYLRSYAKVVGLDEKVVLTALEQTADIQPKDQEIEMQSFSRKTKHEKHNSRIMFLTWVIAIVITGISAAWWWQNQQDNSLTQVVTDSSVEGPEPSAQELADIDQMSADELIASAPADITVSAEQPVAADEALSSAEATDLLPSDQLASTDIEEPVAVIEEAEVVEEPAIIVPEGMSLLTMTFKADCWIQVKDTNGKTLVSGTHKPGQDVELTGKAPFKVILGAPEGVTMTFASEPVDLSGYTSGKVARFTLPL